MKAGSDDVQDMADTLRTRVGRKLAEHRRARGLSQASVAESSGVSASYLSDVERGTANPTVEFFERLESVLGWKLDNLFAPHISEVMRLELLAATTDLKGRLDALERRLTSEDSGTGDTAAPGDARSRDDT